MHEITLNTMRLNAAAGLAEQFGGLIDAQVFGGRDLFNIRSLLVLLGANITLLKAVNAELFKSHEANLNAPSSASQLQRLADRCHVLRGIICEQMVKLNELGEAALE